MKGNKFTRMFLASGEWTAKGLAIMANYTPEQRIKAFWNKVAITANPDLCWEWKGCCNIFGYGQLTYNRKHQRAHRIAWILSNDEIPNSLHVLHKCDNRKCCNPNHLFLGTNTDNVHDKEMKGRGNQPREKRNAKCKLTDKQVEEIRERYSNSKISQYVLADEYGVKQGHISGIIRMKYRKY